MSAPVSWRKLHQCRVCGGSFSTLFCDLGAQPLANSYVLKDAVHEIEQRIPLRVIVCGQCRLVQLEHLASSEAIFSDYPYLSSVSSSFVEHAGRFSREQIRRNAPRFVVELASNDGYLLQHFVRAGIRCLGVEPAKNVAALAEAKGVPTQVGFFGLRMATEIVAREGQADLIIANNVLAHVPDVNDFVAGIACLLAPDGKASLEFPHLLTLMAGAQFDTTFCCVARSRSPTAILTSFNPVVCSCAVSLIDVMIWLISWTWPTKRFNASSVEETRLAPSATVDVALSMSDLMSLAD